MLFKISKNTYFYKWSNLKKSREYNMIERIIKSWCYLLLLLIMISSCTGRKGSINTADPTACNSIYYWKTTFFLNDYEQSFLQEHDIHRMYVKFFDVDDDARYQMEGIATAHYNCRKPHELFCFVPGTAQDDAAAYDGKKKVQNIK